VKVLKLSESNIIKCGTTVVPEINILKSKNKNGKIAFVSQTKILKS